MELVYNNLELLPVAESRNYSVVVVNESFIVDYTAQQFVKVFQWKKKKGLQHKAN